MVHCNETTQRNMEKYGFNKYLEQNGQKVEQIGVTLRLRVPKKENSISEKFKFCPKF